MQSIGFQPPFSSSLLGVWPLQCKYTQTTRKGRVCRSETIQRNPDNSDDDLDSALSIELRHRSDPQYLAKAAKRLDVLWSVSAKKKKKPDQCACCGGSGRGMCYFCRGTGALTLGSTVFCSLEGCKRCPVCKSKGSVKCEHCSGTGFRASWMEEPNCSVDLGSDDPNDTLGRQ